MNTLAYYIINSSTPGKEQDRIVSTMQSILLESYDSSCNMTSSTMAVNAFVRALFIKVNECSTRQKNGSAKKDEDDKKDEYKM